MIGYLVGKSEEFILKRCTSFTSRSNWVLIISVLAPFIILFFACPSYDLLYTTFSDTWRAVLSQAEHPLQQQYYYPASHEAKLAFRLTVPVLAHFFNMNVASILILQMIFGCITFYFMTKLFLRITNDNITALLLTLGVAFIYSGRVHFTEIKGIFDGIAIGCLVLSVYFRNPLIVFAFITLSAWTDERGLIASSLVFIYWFINNRKLASIQTAAVVVAWIAYFSLRLLISKQYGLQTPSEGIGFSILKLQVNNIPLGTWSALEGFWMLVVLSFFVMFKTNRVIHAMMFLIPILIIVAVSMSVVDITRSMAYMLPAVFISLLVTAKATSFVTLRRLAMVIAAVCFLYPAYYTAGINESNWYYPFFLQLLRYFFGSGS